MGISFLSDTPVLFYEPYKLNTAFGKAYLPQQFGGTGSDLLEELRHEQA
jgi:hypothetical protein